MRQEKQKQKTVIYSKYKLGSFFQVEQPYSKYNLSAFFLLFFS